MKKSFLAIILAMFLFSCSTPENQFEIIGNLPEASDNWVVLAKAVDNDLKTIDSVMVKGGKFYFKGIIDFPEMYYLYFKADDKYLGFFIEPGKMNISGTFDEPIYDGLPIQALYDKLMHDLKSWEGQFEILSAQYREASAKGDLDMQKAIEEKAELIETERNEHIMKFIEENSNSVIAPFLLYNNIHSFDIEKVEAITNVIDSSVHKSVYYTLLNDELEKLLKVSIGRMAPLFSQNDPAGHPVALESFRGKYLLIDFWASWCQPCRLENPNLVANYAKYRARGFEIFGVSLDRDRAAWLKGIADDNLTWPQVSDLQFWNNEASRLYGVNSIPANFLLDPDGIIIAKGLRGKQLEDKLAEIFP